MHVLITGRLIPFSALHYPSGYAILNPSNHSRDLNREYVMLLFLKILLAAAPYLLGMYFTFLSFPVCLELAAALLITAHRNGHIKIFLSFRSGSFFLLPVCYLFSILWSADRGTAPFGFVRYLAPALFLLCLMQVPPVTEPSSQPDLLEYLPLSGCMMVLISWPLSRVPSLGSAFSAAGRLGGFFQYPNTFALFLLLCLIEETVSVFGKRSGVRGFTASACVQFFLLAGIFESGSRAVFFLSAAMLLILTVYRIRKAYHQKNIRKQLTGILLPVCFFSAFLILSLLHVQNASASAVSRFMTSSTGSSTLLGRLLYYKDALPVILRHPFGLGYGGYAAMQGSFQHGVYHVSHVHSGLLQLLLDIGWIPTALISVTLLSVIFRKKTSFRDRLVLAAALAHACFDFDLQFMSLWLILAAVSGAADQEKTRIYRLDFSSLSQRIFRSCVILLLVPVLWLSLPDFLCTAGRYDASLKIAPFQTRALLHQLSQEEDLEKRLSLSEHILRLDPWSAEAESAKADVLFRQGRIPEAVSIKKSAIRHSRYSLQTYTEYFDMLDTARYLYQKAGRTREAAWCRERLLEIPAMLKEVRDTTDPLAWKIRDKPELELPEEQLEILESLSS